MSLAFEESPLPIGDGDSLGTVTDDISAVCWLPTKPLERMFSEIRTSGDGQPTLLLRGDTEVLNEVQDALSSDGIVHGEIVTFLRTRPWMFFGTSFTVIGPLNETYYLPPDRLTEVGFRPRAILMGRHLRTEQACFRQASFSFDLLHHLINHRLPIPTFDFSNGLGDQRVPTLGVQMPDWSASAATSLGEVTVSSWWAEASGRSRLEIERRDEIRVESEDHLPLDQWMHEVQTPLEALLAFLLNSAVSTKTLGFIPDTDGDSRWTYVIARSVHVLAEHHQDEEHHHEPLFRLDESPIPLSELIGAWFVAWHRHRDSITLLLADYGDLHMTPEFHFLSMVQAVEGWHRSLAKTSGGGRVSLKTRLLELFDPVKMTPLGLVFGGDRRLDETAEAVRTTRDHLTHRFPETKSDPVHLWLKEKELNVLAGVLGATIASHLLNELGLAFADQQDTLTRSRRFNWAVMNYQPIFHQRRGDLDSAE